MRIRQHRLRQTHHLAVRGIGRQDIRAHGSDVLCERHHQFLADGVDGRVRHLCKLLAEVVEQQLRAVADDGQRGVVTHRRHGLLPCRRHRDNRLVNILLPITELHQPLLQVLHAVRHMAPALQFLQLHAVLAEPLTIRMRLGQLLLYLTVVVDLSLLRVDEQNLSRLQTTLAHHITRLKVHHAHFRRHHHHTLFRNRIARGAQAVAVEHTARIPSVGEQQCGRTVPRLHQYRVVFVEGFQVFTDGILVVERFRHEDGHRLRQ